MRQRWSSDLFPTDNGRKIAIKMVATVLIRGQNSTNVVTSTDPEGDLSNLTKLSQIKSLGTLITHVSPQRRRLRNTSAVGPKTRPTLFQLTVIGVLVPFTPSMQSSKHSSHEFSDDNNQRQTILYKHKRPDWRKVRAPIQSSYMRTHSRSNG